jgi:steroid delta-isomerase-like uncharacterized protein
MAKPVKKAGQKAAKANKPGTKKPAAKKSAPAAKKSAPAAKAKAAPPTQPKKPTPPPAAVPKVVTPPPAAVVPRPVIPRLKTPTGPGAARLIAVRNLIDAERRHDLPALLACFSAEPTLEFAGGPRHVGTERVGQIYGDLLRAFPDLTLDVMGEHLAEHSVVLEMVMHGTHRQQWLGMAPRGRTLTLPVCSVFLFDKRDQMTGQRIYLDRNLAIVQLTSGLLR